MPSEPSDGIFDSPAVDKRGAGVEIPKPSFPIHRNLETRHSRAGGNPDLSAQKLIG
ncbi:hypothetical protein [Neisseria meningitidis]|uniref:hypothetical protein n=1 Tax=Neisseria meningitidis TaxID=487 RepID=UPI00161F70D4|nr:hypothetical protein [Neisseria meningitidis]